jgi:hypothetical protein
MKLSPDQETVWCHGCLKWHNLDTETILLDTGDVICIYCDAHLGYMWDVEKWQDNEN